MLPGSEPTNQSILDNANKFKASENVSRNESQLETNNCSEYLVNTNRRHSVSNKDYIYKTEHKTATNFYQKPQIKII